MYVVNNPIGSAINGMSQAQTTYGQMDQNTQVTRPQSPNAMGTVSNVYSGGQAVQTVAPEVAGSALGWVGGIGAAAALDQMKADEVAGITDPNETHERNTRGLRYGGMSPLQTSLIEDGLGKKGTETLDKITDPTGMASKAEKVVGKGIAGTVPEMLGGNGKYDPIGSFLFS